MLKKIRKHVYENVFSISNQRNAHQNRSMVDVFVFISGSNEAHIFNMTIMTEQWLGSYTQEGKRNL